MVIGIGTGLVALGLALPTGLAFGYGYGYGVRQGYSAFRPPGKTAMGLKQSPDPIQGSLGMGLQVAEERTNTIGLGRPSIQSAEPAIMSGQSTSVRQSVKEQNRSTRSQQEIDRLRYGYKAPKFKSGSNRYKKRTFRAPESRKIRPWWQR